MSAHDHMRMMLDQLMGTSRDGGDGAKKTSFEDKNVCKSFLLGCCPHDLLSSTRMDLGECPLIHDVALKADYEMASKKKDYFYDVDAMEHLEKFLGDCDSKVEHSKRRLRDSQDEVTGEALNLANKIHEIGEQIGTKLVEVEKLGEDGKVEESLKLLGEIEELRKNKVQVELEYRSKLPQPNFQQQTLRVCEVCGALLGIYDNDRRLADHFGGKLHVGFIILRKKFLELKQNGEERKRKKIKEREKEREKSRVSGNRSRERDREKDRSERERSRGRSDRSGSKRHLHSSHRRSRSRSGGHSRSHKKHKHSKRSRSKERNRGRD